MAAPAEAAGQSVNGYRNQLTALSSFSSSDQEILLATMSAAGQNGFSSVYGWQAFATVDDWKSALQQEAASFDAHDQLATAATNASQRAPASQATASDTATADPLYKLIKSTLASASAISTSDIALQVITAAAHRRTEPSRSQRGDDAAGDGVGRAKSDQQQTRPSVNLAGPNSAGEPVWGQASTPGTAGPPAPSRPA